MYETSQPCMSCVGAPEDPGPLRRSVRREKQILRVCVCVCMVYLHMHSLDVCSSYD